VSNTARCTSCQSEIPVGSPAGLCPKCLMKAGFESHVASAIPESQPFVQQSSERSVPEAKVKPSAGAKSLTPTLPEELAVQFPQLEIIELIGKGGMGAVYKARQPNLDRLVAIKILSNHIESDSTFTERFQREAKALARLHHPGIVSVFDFGQTGSMYFLMMEYVDGLNLRQAIKAGTLTAQDALSIVPKICEALQFAHEEGVVHRDIKPENILIDKRGHLKIADFGLAKILDQAPDDFALTHTNQVLGTPKYMAPEQLEGTHGVDHRADIYSLGVVFYELLTGELPIGRFPLPSQKTSLDRRLDEVVLRALEKDPELRYQAADEFKTNVESVVQSSTDNVMASPPSEIRRRQLEARRSILTWGQPHRMCWLILCSSIGCYLMSMFLPAGYVDIDTPETKLRGTLMNGLEAFQAALRQGYTIWFANPILWVGWSLVVFRQRALGLLAGIVGLLFAAEPLLWQSQHGYSPKGLFWKRVIVLEFGYHVWFFSFLLFVVGMAFVMLRTELRRSRAKLVQ